MKYYVYPDFDLNAPGGYVLKKVTEEQAIKMQKETGEKNGRKYFSDEIALKDFCVLRLPTIIEE